MVDLDLIFGPHEPLIDRLERSAKRHTGGKFRGGFAWAKEDGAAWFLETVRPHVKELHLVIGINEEGTTVEAMLRLLEACDSLYIYYSNPYVTFHPKLYFFDDGKSLVEHATIMVGSSNLTRGGLSRNLEMSLAAEIGPPEISSSERKVIVQAEQAWNSLILPPYAHRISIVDDIQRFYEGGRLVLERTLRSRRRVETRTQRNRNSLLELPTAPPKNDLFRKPTPIAIPFPIGPEVTIEVNDENQLVEVPVLEPVPDSETTFFVCTLPHNDVLKLNDLRPGTLEPNLGLAARDANPKFWGWDDKFSLIRHRVKERFERTVRVVYKSNASPEGIDGLLTLWVYPLREGHPEEMRMVLKGAKRAVPPDFDTTSLLVFERESEDKYVVHLITKHDERYSRYGSQLTEGNMRHRYGYGLQIRPRSKAKDNA